MHGIYYQDERQFVIGTRMRVSVKHAIIHIRRRCVDLWKKATNEKIYLRFNFLLRESFRLNLIKVQLVNYSAIKSTQKDDNRCQRQ